MNNYKWTIFSIGKWNRETFPDTNAKEQRIKAVREAREYYEANTYDERIKELADFYIVNAGLAGRFTDEGGQLVCDLIRETPMWFEVNQAVQEKMEINSQRKWHKEDGEWRHVNEKAKSNV